MNHKTLSQIIVLCGLLLTQSMGIAGLVQSEPIGNGTQPRSVQLTSRIELERLVDLTAQVNGVEIEYPTNVFRGKSVTFRLTHELSPTELWSLCLKTLHKEDQTIVRQDGERGLYSVVTLATAANEALPSDTLELEGLMPGYQSVIIPLQRVQPEEMAERISSIVKPSNAIGIEAIEGLDGVVVRGVIERVKVVVDLVRRFDAESSESGMVVVDVVNRTALEVVAEVNAIISALAQHNNESLESSLIASSGGQSIRVYGPVSEQERIRSLVT